MKIFSLMKIVSIGWRAPLREKTRTVTAAKSYRARTTTTQTMAGTARQAITVFQAPTKLNYLTTSPAPTLRTSETH